MALSKRGLPMIPLLARRIGFDTISKFEAAAIRRFQEGKALQERGQLIGAVYLYGYVAEARMQAAYYRLISFRPNTEITPDRRRLILHAARQKGLIGGAPHDVAGLADLLIFTRKDRRTGYPRALKDDIIRHARGLYARWRPALRYRAIIPALAEVSVVYAAAEWFEENYNRLWS